MSTNAPQPCITLRRFEAGDTPALLALFYHSVHTLAAGEYTPAQLDAWAPPGMEKDGRVLAAWRQALAESFALVAVDAAGGPVGFGNLVCPRQAAGGAANAPAPLPEAEPPARYKPATPCEAASAELDRLYVAPAAAGKGVGTALTAALEAEAAGRGITSIHTYASRVARPFFTARGWQLVRPNLVQRQGQTLQNFVMQKEL